MMVISIHLFIHFLHLFTEKSRRPWSQAERKIIHQYFKDFLKEMKIPGKVDCEKCLNENQSLKDNGRDWKAIKYLVLLNGASVLSFIPVYRELS